MREGMVDPTGLSFAQPKGGLKRGATLANELKIKVELKGCASQAPRARDDGEARSQRRRTTSASAPAASLAAEKAEEKRVACEGARAAGPPGPARTQAEVRDVLPHARPVCRRHRSRAPLR